MDPLVLRNGLIYFIILAASLCLRAYAQAWMANRLGDRTPAMEGRLTANPLPHVDILGTVALPLIFIFYLQPSLDQAGLRMFLGWAKPVNINPHNFKNPRGGAVLVAFAGMGLSLLLCLFGAIAGGLCYRADPQILGIFGALIAINGFLVVFDCLPLPPLPGGMLLRHLGYISEETYLNIARWSGLAIIILINLKPVAMLLGILQGLVTLPFYLVMERIAL
ncbi:MAG TPA: site-2 protease family protein [Lacunisphaera sp.]